MAQELLNEDVLSDGSASSSSSSSGLDSEGADGFEPEWEDILGTGAVLKRTIRKAPKEKRKIHPEYNQEVLLHAIGKVAATGKVFLDTYEAGDPLHFEIGDMILEIVDHGVMLAARLMAEGEITCVKVISRYAFGPKGLPPVVPADADVEYRLELVQIKDFAKSPAEMSDPELLRAVRVHKERGNFFFGIEEWEKALRCYQRAMKYSERSPLQGGPAPKQSEGEEEDMEVVSAAYAGDLNELRVSCINNSATVLEKMERNKEALDACVALLEFDPKHLKSLLRVARISTLQGNYKEASLALARAAEYYPKNPAVRKHIQNLKARREKYLEKKRSAFSGTLSKDKPAQEDANETDVRKQKDVKTGQDESKSTAEGARESETSPRWKKWVSQCWSLTVLLAPTLAFLAALAFAPTVADALVLSDAPWRVISRDLAQQELSVLTSGNVNYSTLLCDGKWRRASCCVCKTAIAQVEMRTQATGRAATAPLSYRYIGNEKASSKGGFQRNEEALLNELNRACERVPLDIPKEETRIELAKRYVKRSCEAIVETFYDEVLYVALRNSKSVVDKVCSEVIGVCERETPWDKRLAELSVDAKGLDYSSLFCGNTAKEDSACCLCKAVTKTIVATVSQGTPLEETLRNPLAICSNVTLAIPKAETRLALVKQTVGSACLQYVYRYANEIKRRVERPRKEELATMLEELCRDTASCQCAATTLVEK